MKIEIIKCLNDNYSYLLIDESNLNTCVIDPSEATPIINYVKENKFHYGIANDFEVTKEFFQSVKNKIESKFNN